MYDRAFRVLFSFILFLILLTYFIVIGLAFGTLGVWCVGPLEVLL